MKNILHKRDSRGRAFHGWLLSYHTFSFADYFRPDRMNFGALRVLSHDRIDGGQGFMTHPHKNMEIVTIPLEGALQHKDSTRREAIIRKCEVQIMSAGQGIAHSEENASETDPVSLLQIWVIPEKMNIPPRYEQKVFDLADRQNRFQVVVSPDQENGALWINQRAVFSLAKLEQGKKISYQKRFPENGVYFFLIGGEAQIAGESLSARDGYGITGSGDISVHAVSETEILAIEVPMEI
jgi:redox-sensitive bicupin YhaK (pirin superfamily)